MPYNPNRILPDFLTCKICGEEKHKNYFYKHFHTRCIDCVRQIAKEKYDNEYSGQYKVLVKPNTYVNEEQKQDTFEFMLALGYTFNEEYQVWLKPGVKEIINGKIKFLKVNYLNSIWKSERKSRYNWSDDLVAQLYNMKLAGYIYKEIGEKYNIHKHTVYRILKKYEKQQGY